MERKETARLVASYIVSQSRHNSNSNFLSRDLWPSLSAAEAAGVNRSLYSGCRHWQVAWSQLWQPPTQHPSTQHSIAASQSPSQQAANQTEHAFIKILLFNGPFSLHEQEVTKPHILVRPRLTFFFHAAVLHNGMDCGLFLFREDRDFYFHFSSVCLKQAQCLIFVWVDAFSRKWFTRHKWNTMLVSYLKTERIFMKHTCWHVWF